MPQQYTSREQEIILHDLEESKREAAAQGDHLRSYYLNQINSDVY